MTTVPERSSGARIAGVVRDWHPDDGWGVIDSAATPGGCWAHYSSVRMPGYRFLTPGQAVALSYERAEQDGYAFRATRVALGVDDDRDDWSEVRDNSPSGAYGSELRMTFDD